MKEADEFAEFTPKQLQGILQGCVGQLPVKQQEENQEESLMSQMESNLATISRRMASEHGNILFTRVYRLLRWTRTTNWYREEVERRFRDLYTEGIDSESISREGKFTDFELITGCEEPGMEDGPFTRDNGAILERRVYIIAVREHLRFLLHDMARPNDIEIVRLTDWRGSYNQYFNREPLGLEF